MKIPERLKPFWPCYRLWVTEHSTWTELTQTMSLDAVLDCNDVLDAWDEAGAPPPMKR